MGTTKLGFWTWPTARVVGINERHAPRAKMNVGIATIAIYVKQKEERKESE